MRPEILIHGELPDGGLLVTPDEMRQRGADAAREKRGRQSHGMHWSAPALVDWLAGYDEIAAAARCNPGFHDLTRDAACLCAASCMVSTDTEISYLRGTMAAKVAA